MRFSKKIAVISVVAAGALVAGTAFAYWSTTGSGTGSASTAEGVVDKLLITNPLIAPMFPGDTEQNVTVTVKNDAASQSVYVSDVSAYITTSDLECTGDDFLLDGAAAPSDEDQAVSLAWTAQELAAGASDTIAATIQFNNDSLSEQDACKGVAVTVHYVASLLIPRGGAGQARPSTLPVPPGEDGDQRLPLLALLGGLATQGRGDQSHAEDS